MAVGRDHVFQLPGHFRAVQKLKHVIKGPNGLGHQALFRKPVTMFVQLLSKEMLPDVQSKLPLVPL